MLQCGEITALVKQISEKKKTPPVGVRAVIIR